MRPIMPPAELLEDRLLLAAQFADVIDNPFMPMIPGSAYIYRGSDEGDSVRIRTKITHDTKTVMGVDTTVVRDREFVNGELIEDTLDYYAQDVAGNVWYFGEDSQQIENGQVVGTEGSWLAGENGAEPGIIMKANPAVGDSYDQEVAPGTAEDHAEVLSLDRTVSAPFGTFGNCLKTAETTPLEPDALEYKYYAPGIGQIKAKDITGGDEVVRLTRVILPPEAFVQTIDNPYFPLAPGTVYVYRGIEDGEAIRDRVKVTHGTKTIDGVSTTVVRDRVFVAGQLAEDTRDWYAQDRLGNVWYFGEDSEELENGQVVSTEGSWQAGKHGARAGIIMPAHPAVGDSLDQEHAPGVAEDHAEVLSFGNLIRTPVAAFGDCMQTAETTPLEPDVLEHKFYAKGIGFVRSETISGGDEILELTDILFT